VLGQPTGVSGRSWNARGTLGAAEVVFDRRGAAALRAACWLAPSVPANDLRIEPWLRHGCSSERNSSIGIDSCTSLGANTSAFEPMRPS
jgi:hypothetical protein